MQTIAGPLQAEFEKKSSNPERKFLYTEKGQAPVDKTNKVETWSPVTRQADVITSGNITLSVENSDRSWNDILANPQNHLFGAEGEIQIGYTAIGFMSLFKGRLELPNFKNKETVGLSFRDRISYFTKRKIGSKENPADYYSASSYTVFGNDDWSAGRNPAHLVWHILTVWGGLDVTEGAGNTDIDWAKFVEYRDTFTAMGWLFQAEFKGETIASALKELGELTLSTFFSEADGKIVCRHWLGQDTASVQSYSSSKWKELPTDKTDRLDIINRYVVYYSAGQPSDPWTDNIVREDAASKANYGTLEKIFDSRKIWYYDSPSAIDFAERSLTDTKDPLEEVEFESLLLAYRQQLWDALKLTETFYGWTDQAFRIEKLSYNIKEGTIRVGGRLTTLFHYLILDHPVHGKIDDINVLA